MFDDGVVYLVEHAGLATYGTNLFKGPKVVIPAGDGPYTTFTPTGGSSPEKVHNGAPYRHFSAQMMTRATSYSAAFNLSEALWNLFYPIKNIVIANDWWRETHMIQSQPFPMGLDETGKRVRIAFNFEAVIRVGPLT
jgi:Bacteriophage minor capsid protein